MAKRQSAAGDQILTDIVRSLQIRHVDPLGDPCIIAELNRAWHESQADDPMSRHEEGGYVVMNSDGACGVERWPRGGQFRIQPPPPDRGNRYNGKVIIATFHTHPNPPVDEAGRAWEQAPSQSDQRWHWRRKLRGFVISRAFAYEIDTNGHVTVLGKRDKVLS